MFYQKIVLWKDTFLEIRKCTHKFANLENSGITVSNCLLLSFHKNVRLVSTKSSNKYS